MSRPYRLGDDESSYGAMLGGNNSDRVASSSVSTTDGSPSTDSTIAVNPNQEGQLPGQTPSDAVSSSAPSSSPSTVTLNLKTLTGQVMSINLPSLEGRSVLQLKQAFEAAHGIPVNLQRWIWAGREVNDSMSTTDCRLENGCTVHLLLRQNQVAAPGAPASGVPLPPGSGVPPPYANSGFPGVAIDAAALEGMHANIGADRVVDLQRAFQLARAVRIFAIIELIFLVIWALSFPPLAIGVLLCIFGYYGATNVRVPYVALYLVYLVFAVALRVYFVIYAPTVLYRILFVLSIIIEVYIMRLAIQYIKLIKSFSAEERAELMYMIRPYSRPAPPVVQYV